MRELTFKTATCLPIPCKKIMVCEEYVVSIADGWNITEATIGTDECGEKQRLIITVDRDDN